MVSCSVKNCKNTSVKKICKCIKFFRYPPKDPEKEAWAKHLEKETTVANMRVCSAHFHKHEIVETLHNKIQLIKSAIPKIKMDHSSSNCLLDSKPEPIRPPTSKTRNTRSSNNIFNNKTQIICDQNVLPFPGLLIPLGSKSHPPEAVHHEELNFRINELNDMIDKDRKKMHVLRTEVCRKKRQVKTLKKNIKKLKQDKAGSDKKVEKYEKIILNYPFREVIRKNSDNDCFPKSIKEFCIKLDTISPSAYKYVREYFKNRLPHPKTICRWYRKTGDQKTPDILSSSSSKSKDEDANVIDSEESSDQSSEEENDEEMSDEEEEMQEESEEMIKDEPYDLSCEPNNKTSTINFRDLKSDSNSYSFISYNKEITTDTPEPHAKNYVSNHSVIYTTPTSSGMVPPAVYTAPPSSSVPPTVYTVPSSVSSVPQAIYTGYPSINLVHSTVYSTPPPLRSLPPTNSTMHPHHSIPPPTIYTVPSAICSIPQMPNHSDEVIQELSNAPIIPDTTILS